MVADLARHVVGQSTPASAQLAPVKRPTGAMEALVRAFLGEVPLDIVIRETSDGGRPIVVSQPDTPHAEVYRTIPARVWEKLSGGDARAAPKIGVQ